MVKNRWETFHISNSGKLSSLPPVVDIWNGLSGNYSRSYFLVGVSNGAQNSW